MFENFKRFIKKEYIFVIAAFLAIVSCFFVPVDSQYLNYFDQKTLVCLFSMMLVISGIQNTGILQNLSHGLIVKLLNFKALTVGLVFITFTSSIFIANDMALLTFLPLTMVALKSTENEDKAAYVFILQNIAANLGGMLTPFGNPQNIFLFNHYNIPSATFFSIMAPLFLVSIFVLLFFAILAKKEPLAIYMEVHNELDYKKLGILGVLFIISISIVFSVINFWIGLIIVASTMIVIDKSAFKGVDFGLLLTFVAFFIFSGNLARIDVVNNYIASIVVGRELWVSLGMIQIISNVPTVLLLSKFVTNFPPLLIAANIGSFGTLVSSLASLITFKTYTKNYQKSPWRYLILFTLIQSAFLIVMLLVSVMVLSNF